jgi:hypothetical protein
MKRWILSQIQRLSKMPFQMTSAFWERAQEQGSRSTVLRPLGWAVALCACGAITSASTPHPTPWLTILLGIGAGASIGLYLAAFCYCLLKMPEALRTERYSIQKLAIEKGFRGDSSTGPIIDSTAVSALRIEPVQSQGQIGGAVE